MLAKSLANCHTKNVDSILFDDTPGARIRMFIAHENHDLWKNRFRGHNELSVAFHSHHCDLTILPVLGEFCNMQVSTEKDRNADSWSTWNLNAFKYKSKINADECKFNNLGQKTIYYLDELWYANAVNCHCNNYLELKANQIHSICAQKGKAAAWVCYEGKDDPNYDAICYSNADLTKFDDSELYKLMDKNYLYNTLNKVYPQL